MMDHYKFPTWSDINLSHFTRFDFILVVYHTTFMLHYKIFSVTCCTSHTDVTNITEFSLVVKVTALALNSYVFHLIFLWISNIFLRRMWPSMDPPAVLIPILLICLLTSNLKEGCCNVQYHPYQSQLYRVKPILSVWWLSYAYSCIMYALLHYIIVVVCMLNDKSWVHFILLTKWAWCCHGCYVHLYTRKTRNSWNIISMHITLRPRCCCAQSKRVWPCITETV